MTDEMWKRIVKMKKLRLEVVCRSCDLTPVSCVCRLSLRGRALDETEVAMALTTDSFRIKAHGILCLEDGTG